MNIERFKIFRLPSLAGGLGVSIIVHGATVAAVVWILSARPPRAFEVAIRPSDPGGLPVTALEAMLEPPEPVETEVPVEWPTPPEPADPILTESFVAPPPPKRPAPLPIPDPSRLRLPRPQPVTEPVEAAEPLAEADTRPEPITEAEPTKSPSQDQDSSEPTILEALNPRPEYPARAIRRGLEGVVLLRVEVLLDGTVGNIRVQESSGSSLLDGAALSCVLGWKFEPARRQGRAVVEELDVPVRFELSDSR
ncbi:MAG: TonB family protein [Planctomycetota bacterium]